MTASVPLDTPVALFVFNRPEVTRRVFAAIAAARPKRLLVVADGPREDHPADVALCAEVRDIVGRVDWECHVLTHFADVNLGCRTRVSSGLDWVFSTVAEAIVLEDDCLPHPTFFPYCAELLERYRTDPRVMMISGDDMQPEATQRAASYRFSAYAHVWGWASWARAWDRYDVAMADWPWLRENGGLADLGDGYTERFWSGVFDATHAGRIRTWDYQWVFACLRDGLCIVPSGNLVTNIGFGDGATHHATENHLANLPLVPMTFPMQHPAEVKRDVRADRTVFRRVFSPIPSFRNRLSSRVRRIFGMAMGGRRG